MPAEKRKSIWFTDEDNEALAELIKRLQDRSPVKVSQAAALRWAMNAGIEKLERQGQPPAASPKLPAVQPRIGWQGKPSPKPGQSQPEPVLEDVDE